MGVPAKKPDTEIVLEGTVNLKRFPPILRKIAKKVLESDYPLSLQDAAKELKINISSVYATISRERQKGNDFSQFIDEQSKQVLHNNKIGVYAAVVQGAVSGSSTSHNNQKLFSQLVGDTKDEAQISAGSLTIGINIMGLTSQDRDREKGVIDVMPFIPQGKVTPGL